MGLTDSLEAMVQEHDRIGSPLRSRLGPGLPAGTITSTLASIGLTATEEVLELFGWHEILDDPGDDMARVEWCWSAAPLRLDEAVGIYRRNVEIGGVTKEEVEQFALNPGPASSFTGFWQVDWLPILYGSPESYGLECALDAAGARGAVWRANWHPDDQFPTMRVADSLTSFVDRIVELLRLDAYEWNARLHSLEPVEAVFEREGLDDSLRPWPSTPG